MDIQSLKERKKALKLTNQDLADLTGIPVSTISKIFTGATKSPRYDTLLAIEDTIGKKEMHSDKINHFAFDSLEPDAPVMVRESAQPYCTRTYTEADLDDLPEGTEADLIDGILYLKGMPGLTHERIVARLSYSLMKYIEENHGDCEVFASHFGMRLVEKDGERGEERKVNRIIPDLMVICNPEILRNGHCEGPADLVMEVVSPGSSKLDYQTKAFWYRRGGVREYWIIDPDKRIVTVFDYDSEKSANCEGITLYTFEDHIPVSIYGGALRLCLADRRL